jgi:hypothetical protein
MVVSAVIRARRNCSGGSLGGQRGCDCGRDLCLEGRGGGGISHPKRNKKCGGEKAVMTAAAAAAENQE